jgi:hypothetical protein
MDNFSVYPCRFRLGKLPEAESIDNHFQNKCYNLGWDQVGAWSAVICLKGGGEEGRYVQMIKEG